MERWANRVALVTGASEGIGRATALLLANRGMKVIGCDLNPARLQEAAAEVDKSSGGSITAEECDVSSEAAVRALFGRIRAQHGRIDVCVNNAGLGYCGSLLSLSAERMQHMTAVNIIGLSLCTREAVNLMREAGVDDGHVIHMCSMSAHRMVPGEQVGFYAATKHAVRALTEALRSELRDLSSNIRVSEISPALVKTKFFERAGVSTAYDDQPYLESQDIARAIEFVLGAPAHVQVHDVLLRPTKQYA